MYSKVLDCKGLVKENEHLVSFIPATGKAFIFRVLARNNPGAETINYGALPVASGDVMTSYDGGAATVPADGVFPARGYQTASTSMSFDTPSDVSGTYDSTDMWYLPKDYNERLFHVKTTVTPGWLRFGVEVPKGTNQLRFQRDRSIIGVDKSMGFSRGFYETIHIPELRYGYKFGNDMNHDVYTSLRFDYGEYQIGIPTDPNFIWKVLSNEEPAHWVTMPVTTYDASIKMALLKDYGIEGFKLYGRNKATEAKAEYAKTAAQVLPGVAL